MYEITALPNVRGTGTLLLHLHVLVSRSSATASGIIGVDMPTAGAWKYRWSLTALLLVERADCLAQDEGAVCRHEARSPRGARHAALAGARPIHARYTIRYSRYRTQPKITQPHHQKVPKRNRTPTKK